MSITFKPKAAQITDSMNDNRAEVFSDIVVFWKTIAGRAHREQHGEWWCIGYGVKTKDTKVVGHFPRHRINQLVCSCHFSNKARLNSLQPQGKWSKVSKSLVWFFSPQSYVKCNGKVWWLTFSCPCFCVENLHTQKPFNFSSREW